jgi:hypothetical protein
MTGTPLVRLTKKAMKASLPDLTRHIPGFFLRLVLLLILGVSCSRTDPAGQQTVLDGILAAHGGRENLSKVSSLAAEGRIVRFLAHDEGTYRRALRRDGRLLVDLWYPGSRETRILNGATGYRGVDGQIKEVSGVLYLSMVYQYNQLDLPFGMIDGALRITTVRRVSSEHAAPSVITCIDRKGNTLEAIVDATTKRIIRSTGYFSVGSSSTSLSAEFDDYRIVDGILLPFRIINYAGGTKISETRITAYRINPELPDALFTP